MAKNKRNRFFTRVTCNFYFLILLRVLRFRAQDIHKTNSKGVCLKFFYPDELFWVGFLTVKTCAYSVNARQNLSG
jgi:hypothetical protein